MATATVSFADLESARERIGPHVLQTPLTHSPLLSRRIGAPVWLKQENRQHTGSFKPRGALNKILSLNPAELRRGVVAASAGNHALGVAYACKTLGIERATIFVQANASPVKLAKLGAFSIDVHRIGDTFEAAQQAALAHAEKTGSVFVSAYDDPAVVAGQGTCGLEIAAQLDAVSTVIVPVGGGALIAGIALAVTTLRPQAKVIGVNPAASPSALLSLQRGHAIDPYDHEPTLAHGLAGGFGRTAFPIVRERVERIALVSEAEIAAAIVELIDSDQILAEPSGSAALAALLFGKTAKPTGDVVVVISGGNLDTPTLRTVLGQEKGARPH